MQSKRPSPDALGVGPAVRWIEQTVAVLRSEGCRLGHIRVDHLESLVIDAQAVLGRHPDIIQATVEADSVQKLPETKRRDSRLRSVVERLDAIKDETKWVDDLVNDRRRRALAERMLDQVERLLVEETKLKDEKRILDLQLQHEQEIV